MIYLPATTTTKHCPTSCSTITTSGKPSMPTNQPYADGALDHIFVPFLNLGLRDPEKYPPRRTAQDAKPDSEPTWKDSQRPLGPSLLAVRKHSGEGKPLPDETTIFQSKFSRGGGEAWAEGLARYFRTADELRLGIRVFRQPCFGRKTRMGTEPRNRAVRSQGDSRHRRNHLQFDRGAAAGVPVR